MQTADLALGGRTIPRLVLAEFNDPAAGCFEHLPVSEFNDWLSRNGPEVRPPGGESQQDAMRRYVTAYDTLMSREEEVILAVVHRLPILRILAAIEDDRAPDVDYATAIHLEATQVSEALAVLRSDPVRAMPY
jgi:broad specificity phosphatase PhoE